MGQCPFAEYLSCQALPVPVLGPLGHSLPSLRGRSKAQLREVTGSGHTARAVLNLDLPQACWAPHFIPSDILPLLLPEERLLPPLKC